jgi:hypothetical protein
VSNSIAIVGTASSSYDKAPLDWPGVDIWAVNSIQAHHPEDAPLVDLWFELHHDPDVLHAEWFKWAVENQPRVVMQRPHPKLKNSEAYPLAEAEKYFDGRYFTSSIAYMLAMAIMEKPESIGIYGVDMAEGTEYQHQRPCCEYFIGWARGAGIPVKIPAKSALARAEWPYGYDRRAPGTYREQQQNELAVWRGRAIQYEKMLKGGVRKRNRPKTKRRTRRVA